MVDKMPPLPNGEQVKPRPNTPIAQVMGKGLIPSCNGDPREFLIKAMDCDELDIRLRFEAAKTLMPYKYAKLGEEGKKDKAINAAKKASTGRFSSRASSSPPVLAH